MRATRFFSIATAGGFWRPGQQTKAPGDVAQARSSLRLELLAIDDGWLVTLTVDNVRDLLEIRRGPFCRETRTPLIGMAAYVPITDTLGNLVGICPACESIRYRRVNLSALARFTGNSR